MYSVKYSVNAYMHLQMEFVVQTLMVAVQNWITAVKENLQADTAYLLRNMLSAYMRLQNSTPSKLLAAMILSQLPSGLATFRDVC